MGGGAAAHTFAAELDARVRHAMRILANEQTPLAATADIAARLGVSAFHFVRVFKQQVGLSPQDYGRAVLLNMAVVPLDAAAGASPRGVSRSRSARRARGARAAPAPGADRAS